MNGWHRSIAALAALVLPHCVEGAAPPFSFGETSALIAPSPPSVSFTLPRYRLTPAERETIAACLVLEAANQGEFGMRSVMAVIRNRSRGLPELFSMTVLRPKQFSALNPLTAGRESPDSLIGRAARDRMWPVALMIVDDATRHSWHDPTEGATHYARVGHPAPWTGRLAKTVTIGEHRFYR